MTFTKLYETYLKNSSVSELQAQFIWNHAMREASKFVTNEYYKLQLEDECLIQHDRHVIPTLGFVK